MLHKLLVPAAVAFAWSHLLWPKDFEHHSIFFFNQHWYSKWLFGFSLVIFYFAGQFIQWFFGTLPLKHKNEEAIMQIRHMERHWTRVKGVLERVTVPVSAAAWIESRESVPQWQQIPPDAFVAKWASHSSMQASLPENKRPLHSNTKDVSVGPTPLPPNC